MISIETWNTSEDEWVQTIGSTKPVRSLACAALV
jgi:hypothetical protein